MESDTWTGYFEEKITEAIQYGRETISRTVSPVSTPTGDELKEAFNNQVMCLGNVFDDCKNTANEKFDEINTRIELSNQAANPNKRSEQAHVKAGRDGEDFVKSKLEPLGVVRSAVRIPGESHGRREIDLILQTRTHIYLFEIKNWSGTIELTPDGKWRQIRQKHYSPPEIIHDNVLEKLTEKEILFREKIGLQKSQVSSYVIFPKSNVTLSYAIGRDPRVMSAVEFAAWSEQMKPNSFQLFSEMLLPSSWIGFNEKTEGKIAEELGDCTTWDEAFLEGGRRIIGDFKSGPSGMDIDRTKTERVDFQHNRNRVLGNIKAVFGYEPTATAYYYDRNESLFASLYPLSSKSIELRIESVIVFREAGQQFDSKIKINDIVSIKFSKPKKANSKS